MRQHKRAPSVAAAAAATAAKGQATNAAAGLVVRAGAAAAAAAEDGGRPKRRRPDAAAGAGSSTRLAGSVDMPRVVDVGAAVDVPRHLDIHADEWHVGMVSSAVLSGPDLDGVAEMNGFEEYMAVVDAPSARRGGSPFDLAPHMFAVGKAVTPVSRSVARGRGGEGGGNMGVGCRVPHGSDPSGLWRVHIQQSVGYPTTGAPGVGAGVWSRIPRDRVRGDGTREHSPTRHRNTDGRQCAPPLILPVPGALRGGVG